MSPTWNETLYTPYLTTVECSAKLPRRQSTVSIPSYRITTFEIDSNSTKQQRSNFQSRHSRDISTLDSDTTTEVSGIVVAELHIASEARTTTQSKPSWRVPYKERATNRRRNVYEGRPYFPREGWGGYLLSCIAVVLISYNLASLQC